MQLPPNLPDEPEHIAPRSPNEGYAWLSTLQSSPGWKLFARRLWIEAMRERDRLLMNPPSEDEREEYNHHLVKVRTVLGVLARLGDEVEERRKELGLEGDE